LLKGGGQTADFSWSSYKPVAAEFLSGPKRELSKADQKLGGFSCMIYMLMASMPVWAQEEDDIQESSGHSGPHFLYNIK
jgi:hypothetical protein